MFVATACSFYGTRVFRLFGGVKAARAVLEECLVLLRSCLIGVSVVLVSVAAGAKGVVGDDAEALVAHAFHQLYADRFLQIMKLTTFPSSGRGVTLGIQMIGGETDDSRKVLMRFSYPPDLRGTGFLLSSSEGVVEEMLVFLPAARVTRRISASQGGDAFFGTDLLFEDVRKKEAGSYRSTLIGVCEDGWRRVEIVPNAGEGSTYDDMVACIQEETGTLRWMEFRERGVVIRRLEIDLASVRQLGDRKVPFRMIMRNLERGSWTLVETERFEPLESVSEEVFSTRNLQFGTVDRDRGLVVAD